MKGPIPGIPPPPVRYLEALQRLPFRLLMDEDLLLAPMQGAVGRGAEGLALERSARDARLVVLHGSGCIGKTTLAKDDLRVLNEWPM